MGTTAEKLQNIITAKEDIAAAITEKGGTAPRRLAEYGDAIRALPGEEAGPPAPVDAKRLYAATRPADWPPMPEDVPEHTLVFLYTGGGIAAFTVTSEGPYTVETQLCAKADGVWSYTVESTETVGAGEEYMKEFAAADSPEYRLVTVSAASITGCTIKMLADRDTKMPGCVELLYRLPGTRPPVCSEMKALRYVTALGKAGGNAGTSTFKNCSSLICVMGEELDLKGVLGYFFGGCENLMAIDVPISREDPPSSAAAAFEGCARLTVIPQNWIRAILGSPTYLFRNCTSLKEVRYDPPIEKSISLTQTFLNCFSLEKIIFSGAYTLATIQNTAFQNCISLRRLIFDLPNWKGSNFSIANCAFDREGLVEMFESLPAVTVRKSITIAGNPGVDQLAEEDKAIATGKNWTLVLS